MRANQRRFRTVMMLRLLVTLPLVLALSGGAEGKRRPPPVPWTGPVPRADCGPSDRVETGLQGQTTSAERFSGASLEPYNCNLELVGQFTGEGAQWQHAWFDDCAYYGTNNTPEQQHPGVAVIDVSDPTNPQATAYLNDPALAEPWESLKVNQKRKLLGAVQANNGGGVEPGFTLYDISGDCRHPRLLSSVNLELPGPQAVRGHAGDFAPDGRTYYGSATGQRTVYPIDISDPSNPKLIAKWQPHEWHAHDLTVSEDGTRLYAAHFGLHTPALPNNGLVIVDVSEAQNRVPNPHPKVISTLYWNDGTIAQVPTLIRIKGRPFILFTDEAGSAGLVITGGGPPAACAQNLPPYGFARLIDISDETNPKETAKLMLEVTDPANCGVTLNDTTNPVFRYDSHYCTVDNPRNAKLAACSYFQAGVRVFDIRNPYRPKEVAYYKPGAVGSASRPASSLAQTIPGNRDHDWSSSNSRFVKVRGKHYLWITSQDNGFQVLKFTNHLKRLAPGLFEGGDDDDDDAGTRGRDDGRRGRDGDGDD